MSEVMKPPAAKETVRLFYFTCGLLKIWQLIPTFLVTLQPYTLVCCRYRQQKAWELDAWCLHNVAAESGQKLIMLRLEDSKNKFTGKDYPMELKQERTEFILETTSDMHVTDYF